MGTDKALVEVDGVAMAARVAAALRAADADPVVAIGAVGTGLETDRHPGAARTVAGLDVVEDRWPGEGPLGGLASALAAPAFAGADVVVVAPCDQPWLDAGTVRALIAALVARPDAIGAAVRTGDGRLQLLPAAWRPSLAPRVAELVETGSRRLDALAALGPIVAVHIDDEAPLDDVDTPTQLRGRLGR
ncbi:MAG: putative molybdenum cofactor biosynthesis protein [Acidimicrobiales bacterium]|nr:putative molybdenum cofactor biosynthesis protein [Acidimicrobiales bacterium]